MSPALSTNTVRLGVLLASMLLGCAATHPSIHRGTAASRLPLDKDELARMAIFLCQYNQLPVPVLSRLPEGAQLADYIRPQDLDFLQRVPSLEGTTLFDRPGFPAELARYVRCQVTQSGFSKSGFSVVVRRTRPYWEKTAPPKFLYGATGSEQIRSLLEEWSQRSTPAVTIDHVVEFSPTAVGWRADYQLPERLAAVSTSRPAAKGPESSDLVNDANSVPFGAGMTRPVKLSGPVPYYPLEALRAHVEGQMIVKCIITTQGSVERCRVLKPLPFVVEIALYALYQTHYQPVTFEGRPVNVDYTFNLFFSFPGSAWRSRQKPFPKTPAPDSSGEQAPQ